MKTRLSTVVGFLALVLLLHGGCSTQPTLRGTGVLANEPRPVSTFQAIDISGAISAEVTVGPEQHVEVRGDDNLVPIIVTEVRRGVLYAYQRPNSSYSSRIGLQIIVTVPELKGISVSGASKANVAELSADEFDIEVSGASKVTASGRATQLSVDASGASRVMANELAVEEATIDLSGASKAELQVFGTLTGEVSGASKAIYDGEPVTVAVATSGASKVQRQ